jgi:hypothetical protein
MSKAKTNAAQPLMENDHVRELLSILKENSVSTKDLLEVLGAVTAMERRLAAATEELATVRQELAALRETGHRPARRALQNTADAMERGLSAAKEQLAQIKAAVVEGCKNAVAAFKEKGVTALHNLAAFFHIKEGLQSMRGALEVSVRASEKGIDTIRRISGAYHEAGRRVQNVGRVLADKEVLAEAEPSGKLAKVLEAPFVREKAGCESILRDIGSALAGLARLEAAAAKIHDSKAEKPSVLKAIREHQEKPAQAKGDVPAPAKSKAQEASI